jgi:hypothetical protein
MYDSGGKKGVFGGIMGRSRERRRKEKDFIRKEMRKRRRAKSLKAGKGKDMDSEEISRPGVSCEKKDVIID